MIYVYKQYFDSTIKVEIKSWQTIVAGKWKRDESQVSCTDLYGSVKRLCTFIKVREVEVLELVSVADESLFS